jgi:hypothetical protein
LPALVLEQAEVDILDIIAPQHRALRAKKKLETEKLAAQETASETVVGAEAEAMETAAEGRQEENIEAEVVGEKRWRE